MPEIFKLRLDAILENVLFSKHNLLGLVQGKREKVSGLSYSGQARGAGVSFWYLSLCFCYALLSTALLQRKRNF